MTSRLLTLSYHSVSHESFNDTRHVDPVFSITKTQLREQFQTIQRLAIPVIPLKSIYSQKDEQPLRIVLTFDDGHPSDYDFVYPLLKEFGFTATFFICLRNIANEERWNEYREMVAFGNSIGAHGRTHEYLTHLALDKAKEEMMNSADVIALKTKSDCNYFAFPGGRFNSSVLSLSQNCGFQNVLTTDFGFDNGSHPPFALHRWQVRRSTSLSEFSGVLEQRVGQIISKKIRMSILNSGKKILGDIYFEKIRSILIPN